MRIEGPTNERHLSPTGKREQGQPKDAETTGEKGVTIRKGLFVECRGTGDELPEELTG